MERKMGDMCEEEDRAGAAETQTIVAVEEAEGGGSGDENEVQTIIMRKKKVGWLLFIPFCGRVYANNPVQTVSRANKIETIRIEERVQMSIQTEPESVPPPSLKTVMISMDIQTEPEPEPEPKSEATLSTAKGRHRLSGPGRHRHSHR
jgi:hypothetical protein